MADDPKPTGAEPTPEDVTGLKNALATERDARKTAEKEAKANAKQLEELQGRLSKLEEDGKSETEKAIEAARKETETKAREDERSKWARKIVQAEVKAVAAQKLADPDDARLLDLDEFEIDDAGSIKGDINAAVDKLLESKPHLAAKKGTRQSIDAGPQGDTAGDSADEVFGRAMQEAAGLK